MEKPFSFNLDTWVALVRIQPDIEGSYQFINVSLDSASFPDRRVRHIHNLFKNICVEYSNCLSTCILGVVSTPRSFGVIFATFFFFAFIMFGRVA